MYVQKGKMKYPISWPTQFEVILDVVHQYLYKRVFYHSLGKTKHKKFI